MRDINLLPENHQGVGARFKKIIYISSSLLIFLIFIYGVIFFIDYSIQKDIAMVQKQVSAYEEELSLQEEVKGLEINISNGQNILSIIEEKNYAYQKLLSDIKLATPEGTILSELALQGGDIQIRGYADDKKRLADFVNKLNDIDDIESTWLNSTQFTDILYFDIMCKYYLPGGIADGSE